MVDNMKLGITILVISFCSLATTSPVQDSAPKCPGGKVLSGACARNYVLTCENPDLPSFFTYECLPERCECPDERPILHNEQCITAAECPGQCSGGMVFSPGCARHNYVLTCANPTPPLFETKECRLDRCECPDNRPILHNGQCITADKCPRKCSGGKVFTPGCARHNYELTCENPTPPPFETLECRLDRCECPDNRPILHNEKCITPDECPRKCSGGKVFTPGCARHNYEMTCENPTPPPFETLECRLDRCECPDNMPILHNEKCITAAECPRQCSGGMVLNKSCYRPYVPTCANPSPGPARHFECVMIPGGHCECPDDRMILHNGQCITADECPRQCSGGMVLNKRCYRHYVPTCESPFPGPSQTMECRIDRRGHCECPDDRMILHNGECITREECPSAI